MNKKRIAIISAVLCFMFAVCVSAASTGSANTTTQNNTTSSKQECHHGAKGMRAGFGGMKQLSQITGISADDLHTKYPQKTSWQIAFTLGKLDALKIAVLANHKKMLDQFVKDGKLTSDDSAKMYADLQKRVSAIDGKNTVILGRPAYMPKSKSFGNDANNGNGTNPNLS
jgi:hypothetical protein